MTKEYASAGVLKRVAEQRHGHSMGTVRPPLVPVSSSFDVESAVGLALSRLGELVAGDAAKQ